MSGHRLAVGHRPAVVSKSCPTIVLPGRIILFNTVFVTLGVEHILCPKKVLDFQFYPKMDKNGAKETLCLQCRPTFGPNTRMTVTVVLSCVLKKPRKYFISGPACGKKIRL
jgi:hypothetical protein